MRSRRKIVVSGYAIAFPLGGQAWMMLHYLLGLSRLGFDVLFLEDSSSWSYPFDPYSKTYGVDSSTGRNIIEHFFSSCGFDGQWVYRSRFEDRCYGLSLSQLKQFMNEAELLVNVSGLLPLDADYMGPKIKVIIDTDPVFTQISIHNVAATRRYYEGHDVFFTYGCNFTDPNFRTVVPLGGFQWHPLLPPVALDLWTMQNQKGTGFTTVGSWDSQGRDIELDGTTYTWRKSIRYEKIRSLPQEFPTERFDLTFSGLEDDAERFAQSGWHIRNAIELSRDPFAYRDYIQHSKAEFSMAKEQNVRLESGWFSDRSATYLASGRPVIVEETGFERYLPQESGVFGFRTEHEMKAALKTVIQDPVAQGIKARNVAEKLFDAEHVLAGLVEQSGISV